MDMSVDLKAARLLQRALDLMNNEGKHWIRGDYKREIAYIEEKGKSVYGYCSLGAIRAADNGVTMNMNRGPEFKRAVEVLASTVRPSLGEVINPGNTIVRWNDSRASGWDEVRDKFTQAIATLKGK